jgi:radical SAM protein with 4Fe4S-binding SPASM domain
MTKSAKKVSSLKTHTFDQIGRKKHQLSPNHILNVFIIKELEYALKGKIQPFPLVFQIQTIDLCNGACIMCPNSTVTEKKPYYMTDQLFQKIIHEIVTESKMSFVYFFLQNEPLMDRKIAQKIKLAKNTDGQIQTYFITNGSLCTSEFIKELEEAKLDLIAFSIDGFTKKTYETIRPNFRYETVTENLEKALQSNVNVCIKFTLQKENEQELKAFKKYWKQRGVPVDVNVVSNRTGCLAQYKEIFIPPPYFKVKRTIGKAYLKVVKCCPQIITTFNILSNGDVLLCCNDFSRKLKLGNVNDTSIKEIWNGEKYQEIRRLFRQGRYKEIPICCDCSKWETGLE